MAEGPKKKLLVSVANEQLAYEPALEFEMDADEVPGFLEYLEKKSKEEPESDSGEDAPGDEAGSNPGVNEPGKSEPVEETSQAKKKK
jgi:hypothetical protein